MSNPIPALNLTLSISTINVALTALGSLGQGVQQAVVELQAQATAAAQAAHAAPEEQVPAADAPTEPAPAAGSV